MYAELSGFESPVTKPAGEVAISFDPAVADGYAALANYTTDPHYGGSTDTVAVFDLRTGAAISNRGGESITCGGFGGSGCGSSIDDVVVGSGGLSAAHTTQFLASGPIGQYPYETFTYSTSEQILASDSTGVHMLDTATSVQSGTTEAPTALLTGLTLAGTTLTWRHAGTPERAVLR